jgi:co-chaperonin GroES (HSP10)
MSGTTSEGDPYETRRQGHVRGFAWKAVRFAISLAVAAGLVAAPVAGLAPAGAAALHAGRAHSTGVEMAKSPSFGHSRQHHVVKVDGTVTSGGAGGNFVLTAKSSTVKSLEGTAVTVVVSSSTQYREPGVSSPSVAVGDFVVVKGTAGTSAGTLNATRVVIPAARVTGDVTSGGAGANFTLTSTVSTIYGPSGTAIMIVVSSSTKYHEPGVSSPSVAIGDRVVVSGMQGGTATVDALAVFIVPPVSCRHHGHLPVPGDCRSAGGATGGRGNGHSHGRR